MYWTGVQLRSGPTNTPNHETNEDDPENDDGDGFGGGSDDVYDDDFIMVLISCLYLFDRDEVL